MADYELWLTDDSGKRLGLLQNPFFISYTRALSAMATVNLGVAYKEFAREFEPYFRPDWRLEVWRSPAEGSPMRREDVFLLRKVSVYTRQDGVQVIQFYGRNGIDLLNRRSVIQRGGTSYALKTDQIDDMMKAIVREQMLYGSARDEDGVVDNTRAWPEGEFTVQSDIGLGPSVTRNFPDRVVCDILKDLKEASLQLNLDASTNRKVYFDVLPKDLTGVTSGSPLGWVFQTFMDLRGTDRTDGLEFSEENENVKGPNYGLSHLEEVTSVIVRGNGRGESQITTNVDDTPRIQASRWNRVEKVMNASSETSTTALQDAGRTELGKGRPGEEFYVTFLNSPGGPSTPRSLYGIDWDLGDLVKVSYAGKQFNTEIKMAYVAVDEQGAETITGRNEIQGI